MVRGLLEAGVGLLSRPPLDPLCAAWVLQPDTLCSVSLSAIVRTRLLNACHVVKSLSFVYNSNSNVYVTNKAGHPLLFR